MRVTDVLDRGLIVSCQALEDEPLHSPYIMSRMAVAAAQGGAIAIRANSGVDIAAIAEAVDLPIIGIRKRVYGDYPVFITPTMREVREVARAGARIVALDATDRKRPEGIALEDLVSDARREFPEIFLMADISTFEEAKRACELGFDLISSTLSGYTDNTKGRVLPDVALLKRMHDTLETPLIAEGGIWTLEDVDAVMQAGVYAAVVGTAITRPREITRRFYRRISQYL
jgi:N-acylglucosamine-6-phosphate 2-epimerase